MRKKLVLGAGIAVVSVMLFQGCSASAGGGLTAPGAIPLIKKDCALCHLPHQKGEGAILLKKPVSELCIDCHGDRKAPAEHKVDITPSMQVEGLPLTAGKITCTTCHDPHKNVNGRMLRAPAKVLCARCHKI